MSDQEFIAMDDLIKAIKDFDFNLIASSTKDLVERAIWYTKFGENYDEFIDKINSMPGEVMGL